MLSIAKKSVCNITIYIVLQQEYARFVMTFSLYPEGVSHTDETMPTSSAAFLEQLQQCTNTDEERAVRDAVKEQTCNLIKNLGGYSVENQIETAAFTTKLQ